MIERGNRIFKERMIAWKAIHNSNRWRDGIPEVLLAMNSTYNSTIKKTPFEVIFRRKLPAMDNRLNSVQRHAVSYSDLYLDINDNAGEGPSNTQPE